MVPLSRNDCHYSAPPSPADTKPESTFFLFFLSHDCDPKGFPHFCPIPSVLWSLALREVLPGDGKGPVRARRGRSQSAMSGMKDGPSVAIAG